MHLFPRRLTPRLILGTVLLVALGSFLSAWLNLREFEKQLTEEKISAADQLSTSITSATWHAMQAGRQEDAYEVMQTMGEHQGVEYIRIFAKAGRVAFSSDVAGPETVGLSNDVCRACHDVQPPKVDLQPQDRVRYFPGKDGGRRMAMLTPILSEPSCSTAACHVHDPETQVLGILDIGIDLEHMDGELASLQRKSFLITFLKVALIAAFLAFLIGRLVGQPVRKLIDGTRAVGRMDMGHPLEVESTTELAELEVSFNKMQTRLREALEKNARFTENLEHQVEARRLELQATQERLIQSDRLASMGQLAASVAHEVNNPISAVLNLSMFLQRILTDEGIPPERLAAFQRHLGQIVDETGRAGRIVSDLLAFSRRSTPHREIADLNAAVDRTVALVRHRSELGNVELCVEQGRSLPPVPCDRTQVEQVLVNLVLNAVEALKEGGTVTIRTGLEEATDFVVLQVEDDGPGIAEEDVTRVFDPFFSTKEGEKGVGLGLAVAYGIVDAHGGRLNVRSRKGEGTVFTVRLPIHPERHVASAAIARRAEGGEP